MNSSIYNIGVTHIAIGLSAPTKITIPEKGRGVLIDWAGSSSILIGPPTASGNTAVGGGTGFSVETKHYTQLSDYRGSFYVKGVGAAGVLDLLFKLGE